MESNLENIFVIALIKDLPYCIIVFVFFLGVCGVYIRENILLLLNPLRFCVSLLKEILSVFVIGILSGISDKSKYRKTYRRFCSSNCISLLKEN